MLRSTALFALAAVCLCGAACKPAAPAKPAQTLALNVDFNCRRDDEPGVARFVQDCAVRGVTRLNFRALMMGLTEHPSEVRFSWGAAAPDRNANYQTDR